jgi:hypothetical protein
MGPLPPRLATGWESLLALAIAGGVTLAASYYWGVAGIFALLGLFMIQQTWYRIKYGEWEPSAEECERRRLENINWHPPE